MTFMYVLRPQTFQTAVDDVTSFVIIREQVTVSENSPTVLLRYCKMKIFESGSINFNLGSDENVY